VSTMLASLKTLLATFFFYVRLVPLGLFKGLTTLTGLFSSGAKYTVETSLLRVANHLFRSPLELAHCVSLEAFHAHQDSSDFFTLCRKVGVPQSWLEGKALLDVGCGVGTIAVAVAREGAASVTGIDPAEDYIAYARQLAARSGAQDRVTFRVGSVYALPFVDGSFDGGFAHAVFEHLDDLPAALEEIYRVVNPGAWFVITHDAYHARYGAHLSNFINVPWPQLFFSEKVLTDFWHARRKAFQQRHGLDPEQEPELLRFSDGFGGVNRLSLAQVERCIAESPFRLLRAEPYGNERALLTAFPFLKKWSRVYPYLRGSAVFLLERPR